MHLRATGKTSNKYKGLSRTKLSVVPRGITQHPEGILKILQHYQLYSSCCLWPNPVVAIPRHYGVQGTGRQTQTPECPHSSDTFMPRPSPTLPNADPILIKPVGKCGEGRVRNRLLYTLLHTQHVHIPAGRTQSHAPRGSLTSNTHDVLALGPEALSLFSSPLQGNTCSPHKVPPGSGWGLPVSLVGGE